ncbi:SusD/RagB family nutrient-binding outer membrane lipoprotein [Chitinophaga sp. GCM10012297]|uniref:SusD/RagB family nutrient-binding outer membrane lipoprotein n=1 Tax=Chitinophaga chungangae TaxID=2821488 RepID=A0ABS3YKT4_9BACT|nr:SusD/RagB family nutrient-binding outer membrane lipoprotein [Chitinophaga chungangae]MBO9155311.1 SusD/RagB family nutrient-binding outer membrane lipoprotein [Chitinophaga chungangae]
MKKILCYISLSLVFVSCKKWVDINENPNSANSTVPTAEQRLPPLIAQFVDGYESAGTRAAFVSQQLAVVYANNNNWNLTRWYSNVSSANWPWQSWYVNTAVNIDPLITAAEKVEAWHYIGAAKVIKAWGFGYLADFYGMLPYDEFNNKDILTPKFDEAEYIQGKVLALLDEAIADLQKTQGPIAPPLAKGDILNKGKVDNWIRLAWGLKARFMLHTSKKANFDAQAVLDAANKGPQNELQSTVMQYVDEGPTVPSAAKEALQYTNTGTTARLTKLYMDYILNNYTGAPTGVNNMEDPRANLLIPRSTNKFNMFYRTQGVDMTSDLPKTGPAAVSYNANTNSFSNKDSIYVTLRKTPYAPSSSDRIQSTGTWYTARGAKGLLLTVSEMEFIKAEVLLRLNRPIEALAAYKAGIASHMSLMGVSPLTIGEFSLSTSIVQNPAQLTMSHIMIQKYIAMSYSPELWVDLRRMNYCTDAAGNYNEASGVYKGFKRPSHVYVEAYPNQTDWPRRFAVASYEINYNIEQVLKANPDAAKPTYLNQPIWWDKP